MKLKAFLREAQVFDARESDDWNKRFKDQKALVIVRDGQRYGWAFPRDIPGAGGTFETGVTWGPHLDVSVSASDVASLDSDITVVVDEGEPLGYVVNRQVLAALFEAERERTRSLQAFFEATHTGMIAVDNEGQITFLNESARRLLDLPDGNPEDPPGDLLAETGLSRVLQDGKPALNQQVSRKGRSYLASSTPVTLEDRSAGAVCVLQDVGELESVSHEIKEARDIIREMEAIFESVNNEIFVTDGDGICLRLNSASAKLCGIPAGEMIGMNVTDLVKKGIYNPSCVTLALKEKRPITLLQTLRGGKKVIATANPVIDDDDRVFRVVCNSQDITELNRLKTLLEEREEQMKRYASEIEALRLERFSRDMVFRSAAMERVYQLAARIASVDSTLLVTGESGVGKQVLAETIHRLSHRRNGPFVSICCGAIPENLLESELFGYEAGAFTGALREGKPGTIEVSHGGTLILDEVGDLPLNLQVKLLHFLQSREIVRVGGTKPRHVDVRVIAATNRNLEEMVERRAFREDLYYRLNVVPLSIPPLRHRKEDIPVLVSHFLARYEDRYGLGKKMLPETIDLLVNYDWPGNIRELENMIERLVVTVEETYITPHHLPRSIVSDSTADRPIVVKGMIQLRDAIEAVESQLLEQAYSKYGNTYRMAEALGVNQSTVVRKMHKYFKPLAIRH